ncbi:MAG: hypothetical protein IPM00_15770 [Tetrasphaera sp.]|nr:hypothetical protein [Tetrasphaera sp.]
MPTPVAHNVAGIAALIAFGLAIGVAIERPSVDRAWLPELGVRSSFAVDGISIPLVLLTALIGVLVVAHARGEVPDGGSAATFLVVYCSRWSVVRSRPSPRGTRSSSSWRSELVLIPMWVLITRFGDPSAACGLRPVALRPLHRRRPDPHAGRNPCCSSPRRTPATWADCSRSRRPCRADVSSRSRCSSRSGSPSKVPSLPTAHLAAVCAHDRPHRRLGAAGRRAAQDGHLWPRPLPGRARARRLRIIAPAVAIAAVISILWGGLICLVERDLKRLIAYSSVAHMGFVVLGLATGGEVGLQAALYGNPRPRRHLAPALRRRRRPSKRRWERRPGPGLAGPS